MKEKIKAIVTGATGMVGEGVLHECLLHPLVEEVLVLTRRPTGIIHPKMKELICPDFYNISSVESQLGGYNACFFCLGVSSIGMKEPDYYKQTYTLTMGVAEVLSKQNPGMTFCYVSGKSTDSTEKGRSMWARVKGKTENDLMKLPFKQVYAFRPGYMHPTPGLKNVLPAVKYFSWLYPILKVLTPNLVNTLKEVGIAMINTVNNGNERRVLEVKDIKEMAGLSEPL